MDTDQLTVALENNNRFFINFFLHDQITDNSPVPDFHVEVMDDMTGLGEEDERYVCALPRDHAKTTLAKLAAIKFWLKTKYSFIIYLSNTTEIAAAAVNDIIGFIEDENFQEYHHRVCGREIIWEVKQTHNAYYKFILFPGHARQKLCIIKALGAGKQVRGINVDNTRPQLAIVDDIESSETLDTEFGYKKLKKWFYGTFYKALDKRSKKVIQLGNMTAYRCLIRDHCESTFWRSKLYGAILNDGTPLWGQIWTIKKLQEDFALYKEQGQIDIWYAEMMNMPLAEGMGLIKSDEIRYSPCPLPEELTFGFITVDPAISTRTWGHRTGLCVHGFVDEHWQVVAASGEKGLDPIKLFDKIMYLANYWKVNVVGIEGVAYQASLKYMFVHLCMERHIYGMEFVDLAASARKNERFSVFCSEIKAGLYTVNKDDLMLTQQMLFYDPNKRDNDCDVLDAAAYGPQMIKRYLDLIINTFRGTGTPIGECLSSYKIAGF